MAERKAIETIYRGCKFRSRLEARWAVFLDALGVEWMYELQGFVIDGEAYLPDFWIPFRKENHAERNIFHPNGMPPSAGHYLEVKPCSLTDQEQKLCRGLAVLSQHCVYAVGGNIGMGEYVAYKWHYSGSHAKSRSGRTLVRPSELDHFLRYLVVGSVPLTGDGMYDFDAVERAFDAARSARFEFGQSGATA